MYRCQNLKTTLVVFALFTSICERAFAKAQDSVAWSQINGPYGGSINALSVGPDGSVLAGMGNGIHRFDIATAGWHRVTYVPINYFYEFVRGPGDDVFAAYTHGILYSSDAGESWIHRDSGIETLTMSSLYRTKSGELLGGTWWKGILRSSDEAITWERTISLSKVINAFIELPSKLIIAGAAGGLNRVIYRSADDGRSWDSVYQPFPSALCFALNGSTVFVGTDAWERADSTDGIYRSNDAGLTWQKSGLGLPPDVRIYSLIVHQHSGKLFAGCDPGGLYSSTDDGISWQRVTSEQAFMRSTVKTLAVDAPSGAIYAGTVGKGIYRSTDAGDSWQEFNQGLNATAVQALLFSRTGSILCGTYGGVYRSSDKGESWLQSENGIPFPALDWRSWGNNRIDPRTVFQSPNGEIFLHLHNGSLFASTDDGQTWEQRDSGFSRLKYFFDIVEDTSGGFLYSGSDAIYRSKDRGRTWEKLFGGEWPLSSMEALAIDTSGVIIASINSQHPHMARSTDKGATWQVYSGYSAIPIKMTVTRDNFIFGASSTGGALFSDDGGRTWIDANFGLPYTQDRFGRRHYRYIHSLAVDNSGEYLFASSREGGVFRLSLRSRYLEWEDISEGMAVRRVGCVAVSPDGYLYAGTVGGGAYRSAEPVISSADDDQSLPGEIGLLQNFPNPFNPSTTVSYSLPHAEHVSLTIYDVLGREIVTLVNEKKEPGSYQVTWNAGNSPSGIYLCRMRAGEYGETRKLLLLR